MGLSRVLVILELLDICGYSDVNYAIQFQWPGTSKESVLVLPKQIRNLRSARLFDAKCQCVTEEASVQKNALIEMSAITGL